jgi:hypothetical protein
MAANGHDFRTPEKRQLFLEAITTSPVISHACAVAGFSVSTYQAWKRDDPTFAADFEAALKLGYEALEDEARRRAMSVGVSDGLMTTLLKAYHPERFKDKTQVEHTGAVSVTVETGVPKPEPADSGLA